MYPTTRVFLKDDNGDKFFGEGPCRLLEGIERTGSLRAAAQEMQMAYTKALHLLKHAEETLGFPLTERTIGGKGGGGSRLTAEARDFVKKYKTYRDACYQANLEIYRTVFREETQENDCRHFISHANIEEDRQRLSPQTKAESGSHCPALQTNSIEKKASDTPKPKYPKLACVLMASGLGQRFGSNKLMAPFHGEPLICRILNATDSSLFSCRVVVTRYPEIAGLCEEMGIRAVLHSFPYRNDTVRLGVEAVCDDSPSSDAPPLPDGCMFCACDQPLLSRETVERMARAFLDEPQFIYRLAHGGTPGNPIIFPKEHFPALRDLPQEKGGAYVAKSFPQQVRLIEAASAMELRDIDTSEDLTLLERIISD